ncbi:hypothetical protein BpHYR1_044233 [Brachionus plicatilis]|uniref:Uncharacterized protein n=1 Tax=Brachionus plicatilis TaxID=10195 RepID=A0A3M7SWB2_BRAPC|nr:hypothetical protein BpHYR1_044233 [Brachionus plicatilis]
MTFLNLQVANIFEFSLKVQIKATFETINFKIFQLNCKRINIFVQPGSCICNFINPKIKFANFYPNLKKLARHNKILTENSAKVLMLHL